VAHDACFLAGCLRFNKLLKLHHTERRIYNTRQKLNEDKSSMKIKAKLTFFKVTAYNKRSLATGETQK